MSEPINPIGQITFDHASLASAKADRMETERVAHAVQYLNRVEYPATGQANTSLAFAYDQQSQRAVITVVDKTTGEVLSQLPSREILRLAAEVRRKHAKSVASGEPDDQ